MPAAKPSFPQLNKSHPLAQGLIGCFPLAEGGGPVRNLVTGESYALTGSGAWTGGPSGYILDCNANDRGAIGAAHANLKQAKLITILWQGSISATPTDNAFFAGVTYNAAITNPYIGYSLAIPQPQVGAQYKLDFNTDGSYQAVTATSAIGFNGTVRQVVGTIKNGTQVIWENGQPLPTTGGTKGYTNLTYASDSTFGIGAAAAGLTRNSKSFADTVLIWNRILSQQEIASLYADPFQIYRKKSWFMQAAAAASSAWKIFDGCFTS